MDHRLPKDVDRARTSRRPPSKDAGQSLVEFALILPVMVIMILAMIDLARVYTTLMSVESAAREAADYGTTLGAGKWQMGAPMDDTVVQMNRRACVAASNLPDYEDADGDPGTGCDNPTFAYCLTPTVGGTCGPVDPAAGCDAPTRPEPCTVTVTLDHDFRLIAPLSIEFFGTQIGFPSVITVQRDSTFAMTDIDLAPTAPPP